MNNQLSNNINMENNVTIIGVGKLGLCMSLCIEKVGFNVLGVDIFPDYVDALNNKTLKSAEPSVEEYLKNSKNFKATVNLDEGLNYSDYIFIVVDTPNSGGDNFYDHSKVSKLLNKINERKVENKNIIICCTVMPGYIDRIGKYLIRDCPGSTLNYSPEFIAQGNIIQGFHYPDIILLGEANREVGNNIIYILHKTCFNEPTICRMTPLEAEITKISVNGFITTKISYANMIADACCESGARPNVVLNAVGSDSRIGNKYFKPGYSFGGPCFPRDTLALSKYIKSVGIEPSISEAAHQYNNYHSDFMTRKLLEQNKEVYVFTNVCYKENSQVPIIEESAKLKIAKKIAKRGKRVIIRDISTLINEVRMEYGDIFEYEIVTN